MPDCRTVSASVSASSRRCVSGLSQITWIFFSAKARRRRMHMVRRDDRDDVDAVGSLRLRLRHLGKARIGAVRRDMQLGCAGTRPLRIGRQSSRDELKAVVEPRGDAVDRADEGALSAADHAQAQPAP